MPMRTFPPDAHPTASPSAFPPRSLPRFCQMMWRLNALVVVCCLALNNSYMLYYICPMHTLFTVFVYAGERACCHLPGGSVWGSP